MRLLVVRGLIAAIVVISFFPTVAWPKASPTNAESTPTPSPTPFYWSGRIRSYFFTRQNASNNPGVQYRGAGKCNNIGGSSTCVNQATLAQSIDLHADYRFTGGWNVGTTYFYADPFSGPCATAATHAKGLPCVSQAPPNLNPDDTVPGFIVNTFYEAYVAYAARSFSAKIGDQLFASPWAGPLDTRLKPAAFQGVDFKDVTPGGVTYEVADMVQWENRTSSTFQSNTLITSFPSGGGGLAPNILQPGCYGRSCTGFTSPGFLYAHLGDDAPGAKCTANANDAANAIDEANPGNNPVRGDDSKLDYKADAYYWGVSQIVDMFWGSGCYEWKRQRLMPYVAVQGGWESSSGSQLAGKIRSSLAGLQVGAHAKYVKLAASFDAVPWHYDALVGRLPGAATCSKQTSQVNAGSGSFPYFLPINAAQCLESRDSTTIAYGGWASPYTDGYATNPLFTTQISQGMPDRRAPGTSWGLSATYESRNHRVVFGASDAWYDYGNRIAPETTHEWDLDGTYYFGAHCDDIRYRGFKFRYRYAERTLSNTFCGASQTNCSATAGTIILGGLPLFKYNRAMLEYDF